MIKIIRPVAACALALAAFSIGSALSTGRASAANCGLRPCPNPIPVGSCQPSSSLTVLVKGTSVVAYVPKSSWNENTTKGIGVLNVEGVSIANKLVATTNPVNSCASNPITGKTVCTANNTDVYLLTGTTLSTTLNSAGKGTIGFSGGSCTNCGVAMDAVHNKAVIGLSIAGAPGFQFLNLATSTFEKEFVSPAKQISEDPLIDPSRNLLLSASEGGNYEIVNIATTTAPAFFENPIKLGDPDSSGEDCSTGIALAPGEFTSDVFLADLTKATFTPGSPGKWTAPSQTQTLTGASLSAGASGIAVAQGTHIGIVSGEFGGNAITAIKLPATSGSVVPAVIDWVTCSLAGFNNGDDPHTLTAYQSPNGAKDAIALLANKDIPTHTATQLAVVDLTKMLNPTIVPRDAGGHNCTAGSLEVGPAGTVYSTLVVP